MCCCAMKRRARGAPSADAFSSETVRAVRAVIFHYLHARVRFAIDRVVCHGVPNRRAQKRRMSEQRLDAHGFDSQGIVLILIVAVLGLVVGGAALWIELR
jgi:hypothetical protein